MKYLCLDIQLKSSEINPEDIEKVLQLMGTQAITYIDTQQQAIFELQPGEIRLWEKTHIKGLFHDKPSADAALAFMNALFPEKLVISCKIYNEKDWIESYKRHFKAKCFGKKLWIYPSWSPPPKTNKPQLCLDPGLAFGTGMHASTALCLQWLTRHRLQDKVIIDYGCGSGILALAAIKLGAKSVWAIDNDPQALKVTRSNAKQNHISLKQLKIRAPEQCPNLEADLIVSNILSSTLIQLAPTFAKLLKVDGSIILSGILSRQVDEILQRYQKWFAMRVAEQKDHWVLVEGHKIQKNLYTNA